ncbi:SIS domain-containing protein [Staphylococcus simulans]|uniref:SIS domain-containing protein n=1 Tax=Staphylococcus simulans TaxID=1286 RepID=UPI000E69E4FC|nr:SIS domain-containing protein [Staphylococcus simulans]RIN55659.1 SIS domain-containing protein [Staphylococcus simulans]
MLKTTDTYREIQQQPSVWKKTFDIVNDVSADFKRFIEAIEQHESTDKFKVILTGAGSSAYVGDIARMAVDNNKFPKWSFESVPTTHFVTNPGTYIDDATTYLVVSFARSGNSPETQGTVELFNQLSQHVYHVFITNNKDGFLGRYADTENAFKVILPDETNDKSLAMTSSFSTMLLAACLLFSSEEIDEAYFKRVEQNFSWIDAHAREVAAQPFKKIFYAGTGMQGELTKEVSLKLNELTAGAIEIAKETTLGFRHGPKAGLNDNALFIMLRGANDYQRRYETDVIHEIDMPERNYQILVLDGKTSDDAFTFTFPNAEHDSDLELTLAYLIFGQLLAFYKSVQLGLNPDNPSPNGFINRVVKGVTIYPFEA